MSNGVSTLHSQDKKSKLNLSIKINHCPQNHPCPSVSLCPFGALQQRDFKAPTVDKDKCTKCGKCVKFCPTGAIVLN